MSLPLLALVVVAALASGYLLYGRFLARTLALDDATPTPAQREEDGVDFVPTRPFYLMGQHFSAIAAAGPIVGPIVACQLFGWIQDGKAGTSMPAFGDLTDEQIWDLINYIQVEFQGKPPPEATPSSSE